MANTRWKDKADIATLAATDRIPVTDDVAGAATDKYTTPLEIQTYVFSTAFSINGKLTAGANEIEGSAFDINGGDISAATISGSLTWSAAQNLNSQVLTNVNIDSGVIDAVTIGTNSACTELQVDNININGNSITSTDAGGKIIIDPNGTGDINLTTAGGFVVFTEGDIKIGATALTATATELNYSGNVVSQLAGLNEGVAQMSTQLGGASHTLSSGGAYRCDTSGLGASMALTLKALASGKAERILIVSTDATQDVTVAANVADAGFIKYDGATTYTEIVLAAAGDFVILESSSYAGGRWAISGGKYTAT